MRISDWSSDVCSSDLPEPAELPCAGRFLADPPALSRPPPEFPFSAGPPFERRLPLPLLLSDRPPFAPPKEFSAPSIPVLPELVPPCAELPPLPPLLRSEEHTSELQSLMRNSYAVFCLKKKKHKHTQCRPDMPQTYKNTNV